MKRLYFDLETSPNIVYSWRVGYKINLQPENIVKERAIICVAWKWEGKDKIHSLTWGNGCDKTLLKRFMEIAASADEIVAHNGDSFDIKWLRTRCLYHRIPAFPEYNSLDTLKLARRGFNFNSNKLDYIAKFLGHEGKLRHDGFQMWKDVMEGDAKALKAMVQYCRQDIVTLEKVHKELKPYTKDKTHVGVQLGHERWSCPACGCQYVTKHSTRYRTSGVKYYQMQCRSCCKIYPITGAVNKKLPSVRVRRALEGQSGV